MIKSNKQVELPPVDQFHLEQFDLVSRHGRDELAEQIKRDIDLWCQLQYDDGPRTHLGASIIGHPCERYIWFGFRWMFREVFSGRMQRLFQRGHLEEDRVLSWLLGVGFTVNQVDIDGNQFRIAFAEGHGGGSSDGTTILPTRYGSRIAGQRILVEIKTQKDKRFKILQGSGVEKEKPQHYVQMSVYGRRLGIQYCLYIAVNKEDDSLDVELVELDWHLADSETEKAERIINSHFPPPRISENPSFWKCKMCSANPVCHLGAPIEKNCRSCYHAEPTDNKQWHCSLYQQTIPPDFIPKGCEKWTQLARV